MPDHNILSDFLATLGVEHTLSYSAASLQKMPFQSLFGFSKLLEKYGIESEGIRISDKSEFTKLPVPFLAQTRQGFLIVTDTRNGMISYLSAGVPEKCDADAFTNAWTGMAFLAYPTEVSIEPDYMAHLIAEKGNRIKRLLLPLLAITLFVWIFIANGLWRHASAWFLTGFNLLGLYLTYLLVQKSAGFASKHADAVCGVLQKKGCDMILESSAARFFGLFGWAEVGFTYFSVSLLTLLFFPQFTHWLALCNLCCLPFTLWSIWYQKYRARHWCTLCVGVQATLWCLFFSYLGGGWISGLLPLRAPLFFLALTYVTVLLALNRLMSLIENPDMDETDS